MKWGQKLVLWVLGLLLVVVFIPNITVMAAELDDEENEYYKEAATTLITAVMEYPDQYKEEIDDDKVLTAAVTSWQSLKKDVGDYVDITAQVI